MANLIIKVRNEDSIERTYVGRRMSISEEVILEYTDYRRWGSDSEIETAILSGDLAVSDGASYFTNVVAGLRHLRKLIIGENILIDIPPNVSADVDGQSVVNSIRPDIQKDGNDVSTAPDKINFEGNITVTNEVGGKATVAVGLNSAVGALDILDFSVSENADGKFLRHEDRKTNETPAVVMFDSKLVGLTFSNRKAGIDCDIEFHVAAEGVGNTSSVVFTWQIRSCRVACLSSFTPDIAFDACDKIAIFIKNINTGNNPRDVVLRMALQVTNKTTFDLCEDFTGDIASDGGGTSSS